MKPPFSLSPSDHKNPLPKDDHKWPESDLDPEKLVSILICKQIKAERKKQNLSQQRLSEQAEISRTGLRHIESLETSPTLFSLLKVSQALGIRISETLQQLDR